MTKYIIVDEYDIEKLVCEEHIEFRDSDNVRNVICTQAWYDHEKEQKEV